MVKGAGEVLRDVPGAVREKSAAHLLRVGSRYARERLPFELWPELCLDPIGEADETLGLFESGSVTVDYGGSRPLPRQLDAYNRRITAPEGKVYVFEDASIVGRRPVVEVNGRYLSASWFGVDMPFFGHQRRSVKRNLPLSAVVRRSTGNGSPSGRIDCGFLLLTDRGTGFHHWFYEILPKLWWYEELERSTDLSPKLVVHSPLRRYQERSLELMGYDASSIVRHPHQRTAVDRLLLAPHPIRLKGNQLQALPEQLRWVGDRLRKNVPGTDGSFGDRIYVSRADANRRRVTNEGELTDRLADLGFESYEPGRLSFEDQVRLFAGADVIVGPHGLAYTNLVYADDATLVELFPDNGATETYFVATEELGFDYEFLTCPSRDREENIRPRDRDLTVPVPELVDLVREVT